MYDSLSAACGRSITPDTSDEDLRALGEEEGVDAPPQEDPRQVVEELWEHFVKGRLTRPTFVMDFPVDNQPARARASLDPGVV